MDTAGPPTAEETFRLMYRSHSLIPGPDRRTALRDLFNEARYANKRRDVTGALLVHDDWFVQVHEGDETVVRELFARIEADRRHDHVELLETGGVAARVFVRWAMARVAEDGESDINLIAHTDGIAPAAPRRDRDPEQEEVLARMRAAARAAGPVAQA